jgi:hypothetical protein
LAWYGFVGLYVRATWRVPRRSALRLWDWALFFLILASLGAWGRAVLVALKITDPIWEMAMVHLFLDLFSDGWFVLALLGLAYAAKPDVVKHASRWATRLLIIGLPTTFVLALPVDQVPALLRIVAGSGGLLMALGLLLHVRALWASEIDRAWRVPLLFLGIKATALLGISLPSGASWAQQAGLRVSYLHWSLLGFVSLGLMAAAGDRWGVTVVRARRMMVAAVLFVLVTLIPLTHLWPATWSGRWALHLAAWATLTPLLAVLMIMSSRRFYRSPALRR